MNNTLKIIAAGLATFLTFFAIAAQASTITTILGSDTLTASRTTINTNFSNLNTDKLQSGSSAAALTITTLTSTTINNSGKLTTANASTTIFSAYGPAYFGATATSSFSTAGALTLITPLGIASGGTASSTSLGGILAGNGLSAIKSVVIGSGLTFDGTTLATAGGGITALGPTGQTQTGGTQLLATSTSAYAGLTSAIKIVGSGDTQTFTPSLSGTLTVAGGGTGVATLSASQLLYGAGTGAIVSVATSSASCSSGVSCSAFTVVGTVSPSITSNLSSLTATDGTLTFSGSYVGTTARTIGVNLASANTWTGGQSFTNASSTGTFTLPVGAAVITPIAGNVAIDTTSGQLRYSDVTGTTRVNSGFYTMGFSYATSSQGTGTTTRYMAPAAANLTVKTVQCDFSNFMAISLYTGSNRADYMVASSTIGTVTFTTNNAFTIGQSIRIDVGTTTASLGAITGGCRYKYTYDAD